MLKGYWEDPYTSEFKTLISNIYKLSEDTVGIELSETFFYPTSGGQPCDKGRLENFKVIGAQYADASHSRVVHEVKAVNSSEEILTKLKVGDTVECRLDWPRRLINMRSHTAGHLVYGAARRLFATLEYAGFHIAGDGTASIYLKTEASIGMEKLSELERLVNLAVIESVKISTAFYKTDELVSLKNVVYTVDPTEIPGDLVRIVDIAGWDVSACGGTHFSNSIEVGPIALTGRENHKKDVTRINYAVDSKALSVLNQRARHINEMIDILGASPSDMMAKLRSIASEQKNSQGEAQRLEQQLGEYLAKDLLRNATRSGDFTLVTGLTRDLSQSTMANILHKNSRTETKTIWCIVGTKNSRFIVVATSPDLDLDIANRMSQILNSAALKGGGNSRFFQAQNIEGNPQELIRKVCDALIGVPATKA